jgi:hypothetical protein
MFRAILFQVGVCCWIAVDRHCVWYRGDKVVIQEKMTAGSRMRSQLRREK